MNRPIVALCIVSLADSLFLFVLSKATYLTTAALIPSSNNLDVDTVARTTDQIPKLAAPKLIITYLNKKNENIIEKTV